MEDKLVRLNVEILKTERNELKRLALKRNVTLSYYVYKILKKEMLKEAEYESK
jgi:hypothetical protein